MPNKWPEDKSVSVRKLDNGRFYLEVENDGRMSISPYNAWRLFGMLSLMLGLPIQKNVAKAIKF